MVIQDEQKLYLIKAKSYVFTSRVVHPTREQAEKYRLSVFGDRADEHIVVEAELWLTLPAGM
jgi:hypothetical protein